MAGPSQNDPLAETAAADNSDSGARPVNATATSAVSIPVAPPMPDGMPKSIGRYHIDGELGHGAMGVVFAAQDPDLERKIALKILRAGGSEAARARLLREARAMARLSHPAVVTVHEVGTAGGVDYVAMELIDGSTVAEWIASAKPDADEILDVFDTAGRGLAAAHAAGLVHRDFKPHNVLRSRRGRVVVTDFGLARAALEDPDVTAAVPGGGAPSAAAGADPGTRTTDHGSLSSTLTATGAVLGTPAYMAPEQHEGAAVGPAADQFAYCVALWEALAGARPFPGQTLAAVRQQMTRGPDPATEAKVPRRLRAPLRRGLSMDPDERFPTMDALLAALRRGRAARVWMIAAASAVVVAAIVFVIATRGGGSTPAALAGCAPADRELAAFTGDASRAKLASDDGRRVVTALDAQAKEWADVQRGVCANRADPHHARRVTCLRAVRNHLETTIQALAMLTPAELHEADVALVGGDPRSCAAAAGPPSRIVVEHDPREVEIIAALLGNRERRDKTADPGDAVPCLRGLLMMAKLSDFESRAHAEVRGLITGASEAADRCGDDRHAAGVTLFSLSADIVAMSQDAALPRRIAAAVERSRDDRYLIAVGDLLYGVMATFRQDMDGAIAKMTRAAESARAIGARSLLTGSATTAARWRFARGAPGDLDAAEVALREIIPLVKPADRAKLQNFLIDVLAALGRGADAQAVVAERDDSADTAEAPEGSIAIAGRLVDEAGKPVAGARVVAQRHIVVYPDMFDPTAPKRSIAVTAADGTFAIESAPPRALVMAAIGERRSRPVPVAAQVELRLAPTGSVFGRVTTVGTGLGRVEVAVEPLPAPLDGVDFTAPLAADGSWRIDHVPRGKAKVLIVHGIDPRNVETRDIVVGAEPAGPIDFEVAQRGVPVHVVVRNQVQAPLSLGVVLVIRGKFKGKVLADIDRFKTGLLQARAFPVAPDEAPEAVRETIDAGDVLTRFPAVDPGEVTVCALGITGELGDQQYMKRLEQHARDMEIVCVPVQIGTTEQVVMVEVPPMKRLPE
jgi:hypothetical protein